MNKLRRFPLALSILAIKTFVSRQLACKLVFAINTAERLNQSFNIITLSCRCSFNLTRYRLNKYWSFQEVRNISWANHLGRKLYFLGHLKFVGANLIYHRRVDYITKRQWLTDGRTDNTGRLSNCKSILCDVRYDFRTKMMFGLSLSQVVCRNAHVLFTLFVFVCA